MLSPALGAVGNGPEGAPEHDMFPACASFDAIFALKGRTASPASGRRVRSRGSSVTARLVSSLCIGGQKNGVWDVRPAQPELLRPEAAAGSRLVMRRHPRFPGSRDPAGRMPALRQGEARAACFLAGQSVLYQALRLLCGRRCRSSTIKDVAQELHLNWRTVKELEKQAAPSALRARPAHAGPGPGSRTRRRRVCGAGLHQGCGRLSGPATRADPSPRSYAPGRD